MVTESCIKTVIYQGIQSFKDYNSYNKWCLSGKLGTLLEVL